MQGFADALHTDIVNGLSADTQGSLSVTARVSAFGANRFKEVAQKSLLTLIINNLRDPTLMLLMAAALVRSCPALQWPASFASSPSTCADPQRPLPPPCQSLQVEHARADLYRIGGSD